MGLEGRIAVVTGGSRGIGRAIALELARRGCDVAVGYRRRKEMAEEVVGEIAGLGRRAAAFAVNIAERESVEAFRNAVTERLGVADILINNAGVTCDALFVRMDDEAWNTVIQTNLNGAFYCTQAFVRGMMEKRWGRIVNITSVVGQMGNPGQVNYAAAKAGLIGFTKALAKELARYRITVNAVAPGSTQTDMLEAIPERTRERMRETIPLRRFATPQEIAHAVAFLCDENAAYITGQVIGVNGGLYV